MENLPLHLIPHITSTSNQDCITKLTSDLPIKEEKPIQWNITDEHSRHWRIQTVPSQPGKYLITAVEPEVNLEFNTKSPIHSPVGSRRNSIHAAPLITVVDELTPGHKAGCPCSKCFLAKKQRTCSNPPSPGRTVVISDKTSLIPREARVPSPITVIPNSKLATQNWWVNSDTPIFIKHISKKALHAYGENSFNNQDIAIWDPANQSNFYWKFVPVPNQPGYFFISNLLGGGKFVMQQMGGSSNPGDRVSMWSKDDISATLPWLWVKITDATEEYYGPGYVHFQFFHSNLHVMLNTGNGYNFNPANGCSLVQNSLNNLIDPSWYFYFEAAM